MSACPGPDLLLRVTDGEGQTDTDAADRAIAAHARSCPACTRQTAELVAALAAPALPFDPEEALGEVRARIAAQVEAQATLPPLKVRVRCAYCHDGIAGDEAVVHCAGCLAPHHGDCFAEHGRCAAGGCDSRQVVARGALPLPPARRTDRTSVLLAVGLLVGGATAAVAFAPTWLADLVLGRATRPDARSVEEATREAEARSAKAASRRAAEGVLARLGELRDDGDERLAICDGALAADPTYAPAYVARARARWAAARRRALEGTDHDQLLLEALSDLDRAVEHDPASLEAPVLRARLLFVRAARAKDAGKSEREGVSCLQRVAERDPTGAQGALAQALLAVRSGRHDQALAALGQAIERAPTLVLAHVMRAEVRLRLRAASEALAAASTAVTLDPRSADALALRAEASMFLSRLARVSAASQRTGALADLDAALRFDPACAHALALRAWVRLERDRIGDVVSGPSDREDARLDAQLALRIDPEQGLAVLALSELNAADGNVAEALRLASQAVRLLGHLPHPYRVRGRLRARDGDDQAVSDFDQVLRLEPDDAPALVNKAAIMIRARSFENARAYLDLAIGSDPELPEAYFQRAMIALRQQPRADYPGALRDLSEAITRKPQFPDAYFYRACAHYDCAQYRDALRDLETAEQQRAEGSGGGFFNVADLYRVRGHAHFALEEMRPALEAFEQYVRRAPVGSPNLVEVQRRMAEAQERLSRERPPGEAPR